MYPFIHWSFKVLSRSFQLAEFGSHAWSRCQSAKRKFLVIFDFKETDSAKIHSIGDSLHREKWFASQLCVSIAYYCCSLNQVSSETAQEPEFFIYTWFAFCQDQAFGSHEHHHLGGASGKEPACQSRRHTRCRFNPRVGKIPWRRAWQSTPVFLPGESHGQRTLLGYSPQGHKELDMTEVT